MKLFKELLKWYAPLNEERSNWLKRASREPRILVIFLVPFGDFRFASSLGWI